MAGPRPGRGAIDREFPRACARRGPRTPDRSRRPGPGPSAKRAPQTGLPSHQRAPQCGPQYRQPSVCDFDFTCMDSRPHLDTEGFRLYGDRPRAADRTCRPVKGCEEAVTRCVHLRPAVPSEQRANHRSMPFEEVPPPAVAGCHEGLRGCRRRLRRGPWRAPNQLGLFPQQRLEELVNRAEDRSLIARPDVGLGPGQLATLRSGDGSAK